MRIAATAATLLFALASCSTTNTNTVSPYQQPNALMGNEISQRIEQIPYQHREELVQNLLWLAQTGEQTIPALLQGLSNDNPKVRSSCCWVLGRLRDRRTVESLQRLTSDSEVSVRMEASRSLVLMGDIEQAPNLIEGLDSERKEVRYMCHEALKSATGHDFDYDHLNQNQQDMQLAVLRWRQWWGEYSGDQFFAQSYEQKHGLNNLAAPGGETKLMDDSGSKPESKTETPKSETPKSETPKPETSTTGSPTTESSKPETPKPETSTNTSNSESPTGANETPSSVEAEGATKPASKPRIVPPVIDAPKPGSGTGNGASGSQSANGAGSTGTGGTSGGN